MDRHEHVMKMGWGRFGAMIASSIVIMFFLMYQLVYSWDHALFSVNRLMASLVMGCVMTAVMLGFMWPMYQGQGVKLGLLIGSISLGLILLYVNRSQAVVGDTAFMRAMIPHHSIAINNARRANITDPRVRKLADAIIQGQMKEIAEMKILIEDISQHGSRGQTELAAVPARLPSEMGPEIRKAVR